MDVPFADETCMIAPLPKLIVLSEVNPDPLIVTDVPTVAEDGVREFIWRVFVGGTGGTVPQLTRVIAARVKGPT